MNDILVSIIIPIYNAEKYIQRCVDSVLEFGKSIEVILVNDGSTDGSKAICEEYVTKDVRVKLYNQNNQGVSSARNYGIDKSVGKWILFLDADDYLSSNYYLAIDKLKDNLDIALFAANWEKNVECNLLPNKRDFSENEKLFLIKQTIKSLSFHPNSACSLRSPCFKAYKRSFINENNIRFPVGVSIGEDFIFNIYAYSKATTIKYYPVVVYAVVRNEESATHRFVPDMLQKELIFQHELKKALVTCNLYDDVYEDVINEQRSGIMRCLRKQIFSGAYSLKYKYKLLNELVSNEEFYKILYCDVLDRNVKRKFIFSLVKKRRVVLLTIIFKYAGQ